jgi:hypothetical protein
VSRTPGTTGRVPAAFVEPPAGSPRREGVAACTLTAVALLAWLIGPAPTVALTSGVGLVGHLARARQAHRAGTCILRDTRLVLAYLAVAFAAGAVGTVWPFLT